MSFLFRIFASSNAGKFWATSSSDVSSCAPSLSHEAMLPHSTVKSHSMEESELSAFSKGGQEKSLPLLAWSQHQPFQLHIPTFWCHMLCSRQAFLFSLCFVFLKQDLDQLQLHLEEVRFFDVFGFSETAGAWQCFMCNNPEKATGEWPLITKNLLCPSPTQIYRNL